MKESYLYITQLLISIFYHQHNFNKIQPQYLVYSSNHYSSIALKTNREYKFMSAIELKLNYLDVERGHQDAERFIRYLQP